MLANNEYWTGCVIGLFAHEAGHICLARLLGLQIKRMGLNWFGPYIVRETGSPVSEAVVSAAGPLVNLMLAATMWQEGRTFAIANLTLGLSNFLPLPKCDGGRILRAVSLNRTSDARASLAAPGSRLDLPV